MYPSSEYLIRYLFEDDKRWRTNKDFFEIKILKPIHSGFAYSWNWSNWHEISNLTQCFTLFSFTFNHDTWNRFTVQHKQVTFEGSILRSDPLKHDLRRHIHVFEIRVLSRWRKDKHMGQLQGYERIHVIDHNIYLKCLQLKNKS